MTDVPVTPELSASDGFDKALARARLSDSDPMPVLERQDPAASPARMVAELRKMLSLRFAHAAPAAQAASLNRQATQSLRRLARQLRWRRVRIALFDFMLTYGLIILGLVVAAALVTAAILYRDAIAVLFTDLLTPAPAAPPAATPAASPSVSPTPPVQTAPTGTPP